MAKRKNPIVRENCSTLPPRKREDVLPISSSYIMAQPAAVKIAANSMKIPRRGGGSFPFCIFTYRCSI
ncbi:MAG: hypothetical protein ACPHSD_19525, partial [Candidatus Latescibacterota bacterium]